jgi:hypothetical protein
MYDMYDPPKRYLPAYLQVDPVHAWRAASGIELIHEEPDLAELNRIWANWHLMSVAQKRISDEKSLEIFGLTNADHYRELITLPKYQPAE